MRRAILTLAVLLGACESDSEPEPVELLPAADREGGDQCTEGMPVDAVELYEAMGVCAEAGDLPVIDSSFGAICWSWDGGPLSEACSSAMEGMSLTGTCEDIDRGEEGPDPSACRQVSLDVWCLVGLSIDSKMNDSQGWCAMHDCISKNAPGYETPEAINERADATLDAICG